MFAEVDVEAVVADEAEEGEVEFLGELYGETGGGADGGDEGNAGHDGFLNQFETRAAREKKNSTVKGEGIFHELMADELVEGVVAADVFAEGEELSALVEEGGGVEAAGAVEDGLGGAEEFGQGVNDFGMDQKVIDDGDRAVGAEGFDGGFAADAAGGGGIEMAFEAGHVEIGFGEKAQCGRCCGAARVRRFRDRNGNSVRHCRGFG